MKILAAVLTSLFVAVGSATADCADVPSILATAVHGKALTRLFTDFGIDPKVQHVYFVAIDHREQGMMTAYDWTKSGKSDLDANAAVAADFTTTPMKRSADDGVPELSLSRNARVITILTRTNPPLYTLSKTTTFATLPGLEDLSKIVNAFGQFITTSATRETGFAKLASFDAGENLKQAMTGAFNVAKAVTADRDFTVRFLQYSEEGATPPAVPNPFPNTLTSSAKVGDVFTKLRNARNDFAAQSGAVFACKDLRDLAQRARDALNTPDTAKAELAKVEVAITATNCPDAGKAELLAILHGGDSGSAGAPASPDADIAATLENTPKQPQQPADTKRKATTKTGTSAPIPTVNDKLKDTLDQFMSRSDAVTSVLKTADDLLGTELSTLQTAAEIERLKAAPMAFDPCTYSAGIIIADSPDQVTFDKLGTVKVTIAEASPLGATYHRRPGDAGERSYRTANPIARNISIGVGGIYTPLREPTYTAVTDPTNSAQKVIAKTSEKKRAGAVALLGTYRWFNDADFFRPGVQVGTGFGSDPQIFAGFSVDIGSILRLGVGISGQQVKGLAAGQTALAFGADGKPLPGATVVSGNDDIRTKQRLVGAPYFSLTLSLDSLSLFKRP